MGDIYQDIWSADQAENGIEPILASEEGNKETGYVKVDADDSGNADPDLRILPMAVIPPHKERSYELCRRLFNNYALPEAARETDTPQERAERHEFVEAIVASAPMKVAREYVELRTSTTMSDERWHNTLMDHWFRRFEQSSDPHLSGFEHVVVGEQEGSKVQGYHFWYKYYLDDGFASQVDDGLSVVPGLSDDRIVYVGSKAHPKQPAFPESVTIQFRWNAPDYDAGESRPLHKKIGGFFVGCSVEGLMALGTVRAHLGANAPKTAVIEGARYQMKLFRSANNMHIRTFYPVFQGPADPVGGGEDVTGGTTVTTRPVDNGGAGDVRIVAAFANPQGHDPGREMVTIINTGPVPVDLGDWRVIDKNGNFDAIEGISLAPGHTHMAVLSGRGAQLSNKGGTIALASGDGTAVHQVSYTKAQVRAQNRTLIFG
ncbi:lamin tail domain-containing protein [Hoeflea poritis]|uniref:Lamin tail domain-containing protein n=1 Tax=Hoeflea poritis TaxID=2993659 RepID=A0ABT4VTF4_9HYPH|nr:lamin tail domain-containing protein [Hoeflea poritis]MDA4847996.1 lamin tail domain-containing protein [Hoeflea poritis]